jgi:hypothetical protein
MFVFGGVKYTLKRRTNLLCKIWLRVPKLKEISWEALLHYSQNFKSSTQSELLELGVPSDFVKRIHPAPPSGPNPATNKDWSLEVLQPFNKMTL